MSGDSSPMRNCCSELDLLKQDVGKKNLDTEVRLQKLEDRFRVAVGLAGFFGVGSVLGVAYLLGAGQKLAAADADIVHLQGEIADVRGQYRAEIDSEARNAIKPSVDSLEKRHDDLEHNLNANFAKVGDLVALEQAITSSSVQTDPTPKIILVPQRGANNVNGKNCQPGQFVSDISLIFDNGYEAPGVSRGISQVAITCKSLGLPASR